MSDEERINLSRRLNEGLRLSFERMLKRKQILGESIVTCDSNGNPITIPAEEAWILYQERQSKHDSEK